MFAILYTGSFKKDFKRISKRKYDLELLRITLNYSPKKGLYFLYIWHINYLVNILIFGNVT